MANALPWSVRGIDPDIREQAVEAAHRSGMSVGQWLNQVLAGNLDEDEIEETPPSSRTRRSPPRQTRRIDALNERLERLGEHRTMTAAHRFADQDNDNAPVLTLLESAVKAIERIEKRAGEPGRAAPRAAEPQEDGVAESLRMLERKLTALAEERIDPPQPQGVSSATRAIEERLNGLVSVLDQLQAPRVVQAPAFVPRAAPVAAPAQRSGENKSRFAEEDPAFAERDPAFARALAEIETRRRTLDGEAAPSARMSRHAVAPSAQSSHMANTSIDSMREQLGQLVSRIDELRAEPRPDNSHLQTSLDDLAARIDQWRSEPTPEARKLQTRLDDLASRIDEWRGRPQDDIAGIRNELASLAGSIERLSPQRLVGMVEDAMSDVADKTLRAFRDGMSDRLPERLMEPLERMHEDVRAVLREVASSRGSDRLTQEVGNIARRLDLLSQGADPARLEELARETVAIKGLVTKALSTHPLEGLARQIEALGKQVEKFQRGAKGGDDRGVLDAIRDVSDRVERIDPARTLATIESKLAAIGNIEARLATIGAMDDKLTEIARGMKKLAKEAQPLPQLDTIAERLERIDRVLDHAQDTPLAGIESLADRLDKIGTSLDRVASQTPPDRGDALVGMITRLSERMEQVHAAPVPATGQQDALVEMIARLSERMEQVHAAPASAMGQQDALVEMIARLSEQMEQVHTAPASAMGQQDALVNILERLSEQMETVQSGAGDSAALDALQDEIARLAKRMEQVGQAPAGLDAIERTVSDLFHQFDQARRDMRDMAETAATKAAQDALRNAPRDDSGDTLAAEGLLLIKRDLNEFKANQSEAERRTRGTLEALHATLETLVSRLGEAETRARAMPAPVSAPRAEMRPETPLPAPAPAPMQAPIQGPAPAPVQRAASAISPAAAPAPAPARAAPEAAPRLPAQQSLIDEAMADLPLEPGMRPGQPGSDSGLSADPRSTFIAAARRAAQAAADRSQATLEEEKPVAKTGKPQRGARAGASVEASAAAPSFIVRARRPILLGLAAVVFSLGALKVVSNRNASGLDPLPARTDRPAVTRPGVGENESPRTTGSIDKPAQAGEPQMIPNTGIAIPPVGTNGIGTTFDTSGKRGQRLADTSAISQTDPLTVGSIGADGTARPIETGRGALNELLALSPLKPQDRLREAALEGNAAALFEIGARYADGKGMPRDPRLAARWFEQAAATGHGPSQYRLASLYREGKGVPKDSTLAFQWFDRAAAQGHVLAMHNAAVLLAEGVHGAPDYAGAALWFKRSAEYGIKDSQFNVAILFARGLGVNQDLGESYRWFAIAALQGDQDAAKKRDDLAARLSKDQLAREMERVKAFKPNKANAMANESGSWEKFAAKAN
jgi:localization factor PodJL